MFSKSRKNLQNASNDGTTKKTVKKVQKGTKKGGKAMKKAIKKQQKKKKKATKKAVRKSSAKQEALSPLSKIFNSLPRESVVELPSLSSVSISMVRDSAVSSPNINEWYTSIKSKPAVENDTSIANDDDETNSIRSSHSEPLYVCGPGVGLQTEQSLIHLEDKLNKKDDGAYKLEHVIAETEHNEASNAKLQQDEISRHEAEIKESKRGYKELEKRYIKSKEKLKMSEVWNKQLLIERNKAHQRSEQLKILTDSLLERIEASEGLVAEHNKTSSNQKKIVVDINENKLVEVQFMMIRKMRQEMHHLKVTNNKLMREERQ